MSSTKIESISKKDIDLNDDAVTQQQKEILDELKEKRVRLEMLRDWRNEIKEIEQLKVDIVADYFTDIFGENVSDHGKNEINKWLKKYDVNELMNAIDKADEQYEEAETAFGKIQGIAYFQKNGQSEELLSLYYYRGIMRKRYPYINDNKTIFLLKRMYEHGVELDRIKEIILKTKNWNQFKYVMEYEEGISSDC